MSKRKRDYTGQSDYGSRTYKRPRTKTGTVYTSTRRPMAPMASRGYRPSLYEKKVVDIASTNQKANTSNAAALCRLLFVPTLGSDFNNRVGRKVNVNSIYIRGFITGTQGTTLVSGQATAQLVRILIVYDCQPNGAAITPSDILVDGTTPISHLNMNNRDRFQILLDKQFNIDPYDLNTTAGATYASTGGQTKQFKYYKKINKEVIFNATGGGTIADITTGAIYFCTIGSNASGASDSTVIWTSRIRYKDS